MYTLFLKYYVFRKKRLEAMKASLEEQGWGRAFNTEEIKEYIQISKYQAVKTLEQIFETEITIYFDDAHYYFIDSSSKLLLKNKIDSDGIDRTIRRDLENCLHFMTFAVYLTRNYESALQYISYNKVIWSVVHGLVKNRNYGALYLNTHKAEKA